MPDNDLVALEYFSSSNIVKDSCAIIDAAQKTAYKTVDRILVVRNWLIGKRISQDILEGQDRAEYGAKTIRLLSDALQKIYGSGFDRVSLYRTAEQVKDIQDKLETSANDTAIASEYDSTATYDVDDVVMYK